jgi:hypothetical protein
MDRNPDDANRRAKRDMHEAIDKVINAKKNEPIGTKEAEQEVAADLNAAAQTDTKKRRQSRKKADTANGPHIRTGTRCVTQITVVEADPAKQAEALSVMGQSASQ